MIKRELLKNSNQVKLTFVLPLDRSLPRTSVVGDFNQWDPTATPLLKRSNGTASAAVTVPVGQRVRFRYYTTDGRWFNDETADAYERGDYGAEDCVVLL
jgi:1,4-alpha-glucan branching enzyme